MKETLRAYQRIEKQYTEASMGPGKFHQRLKVHADQVPSKNNRAVREIRVESEGSSSESDLSGPEEYEERQEVWATTISTQEKLNQDHHMSKEKGVGWSYVIMETDRYRLLTVDRSSIMIVAAGSD